MLNIAKKKNYACFQVLPRKLRSSGYFAASSCNLLPTFRDYL